MKICLQKLYHNHLLGRLQSAAMFGVFRTHVGRRVQSLLFQDGVTNVYRLDDCTAGQIDRIFKELKDKGITVL